MSPEVAAIMAQLEALAEHDASARAALSGMRAASAGTLGLHDVMLGGWYNEPAGELTAGFAIGPEDTVIDVGCGDGGALNFCAKMGPHVILADIDAARLEQARAWLAGSAAQSVQTYATDGNPLPLGDASVTRVICMEVLEHVDDPAAFMAELVRVGRAGARYLITVPDVVQERLQKHLAPATYFEKPNHVRIFEREAFDTLVRDAGLIIERRSYYGFFWAMWWLLFWTCDVDFKDGAQHPVLDNWARTWAAVLDSKDGLRIKHLMDRFMPKNQVIVASKPA